MKAAKVKIIGLSALIILFLGLFALLNYSGSGTRLLWQASQGGKWLLPLVSASALIDSINPCAFSILLLTIAFLFSVGNLRTKILKIGGLYILGIFLVYMGIGLGILGTLHLFNTPHFMAKVGASLLIAFGVVNIVNELFPAFPIKLRIPHSAHHRMATLLEKGSAPTAFILGGLVGLCEFPCTGGPYLMVLGLLHDKATYLVGFSYLLLYNLIFILPLLIILFLASDKRLLTKVQTWQVEERKTMRLGTGFAMIFLGIVIFFL